MRRVRAPKQGKGNAVPISLRDIVHPVHMGSKLFSVDYLGDCLSCHKVSGDGSFGVMSLDGSVSGHPLPLTGGHAGVACTQCHVGRPGAEIIPGTNLPRPASANCVSCHGDHHDGLTNCVRCHSVAGWKPPTFTHPRVGDHMPSGEEPVACGSCHPNGFGSSSCSCHGGNPPND